MGPRNSGPIAYARTKTDMVSCDSTSSVMWNCFEMVLSAGATIEDDTGEMKVKQETMTVAAHFFLRVQFLGFSGSSGPSQVTCLCEQE